MKKTGIFYGSSAGNTQVVAKTIAKELNADMYDVSRRPVDQISQYENLILGTSTLGLGDLQDDWDAFLADFEKADLSGKTVALFGLGDSATYADTFVDGMGTIYETIKNKGCRLIGQVSPEGYDFDDSTALVDGKFVGLPLDEDNESNLTDSRVKKWIDEISPAFQ